MTPIDYKLPITISEFKLFELEEDFKLETGGTLNKLTIAYHTYGKLNEAKDNVIWVCHALTANSEVSDWWSGLFGEGNILDPENYYIVCANIIGSNYGSTGARSINPKTGMAYGLEFPLVTIRDISRSHLLLANHLGINAIDLIIGGSCGGHQVQEMCLLSEIEIKKAVMLVTSAKETAWSIAIHEAQRLALIADQSFHYNNNIAGQDGLKAARGMGLIGYRTFEQYNNQQSDSDGRYINFKSSSYIKHQGNKLVKRFHAHCYYHLLNTLDSHNIGRHRGGLENALKQITQNTLLISIDSDMLIPVSEQSFMVANIPNATHKVIKSNYGHDGFLVETEKIKDKIMSFKNNVSL